jgi:transposase
MRELSVAEQMYRDVMAVIGDGLSVSEVAEKVGVTRQTLHTWLARYESEGLEGSRIARIGPHAVRIRCPHRWRRCCWSCVGRVRTGVRAGWCSS